MCQIRGKLEVIEDLKSSFVGKINFWVDEIENTNFHQQKVYFSRQRICLVEFIVIVAWKQESCIPQVLILSYNCVVIGSDRILKDLFIRYVFKYH